MSTMQPLTHLNDDGVQVGIEYNIDPEELEAVLARVPAKSPVKHFPEVVLGREQEPDNGLMDGPKHLLCVRPLRDEVSVQPLEGPGQVGELDVLLPHGSVCQELLLLPAPCGVVIVVTGGKPHQTLVVDVRPKRCHGRDEDVGPKVYLPPEHQVRLL